jgi:hypothetical protein
VPAQEGSLLVARVLAGGSVVVQSAIVDVTAEQDGGWRGLLYVPIETFRMGEAGGLELQRRDGRKYRFVIVESHAPSYVVIRGFGPSPV